MRNSLVSFLFILLVSQMVMSEESQSPCSRPCVIGGFAGTCTSNCPPCYIANGGGFHCFDKANGACPWPGMTDCSAQSHPPPPPPRQPPPPAPRPNPPPSPRPAQQQQQQPQQSSGSRRVLRHLEFLNVGGSGTYNRITNMIPNSGAWNQCANPGDKCHRSPAQVSGPLAPFHEDLTLALRGPMEVHNIAVYVPNGGSWKRVSDWGRGSSGNNLIWMANRGGTPFPGDWSICHGNSQTFASVDGKGAAHNPQAFSGNLGNDVNVNIMSGTRCKNVPVGDNGDNCPGYERGVAYEGWRGNSCGEKMFVIRAKMPNDRSGSNNNNLPAVWLLNGQVVRTNQWGCNCRGVGASGGCGEFDIVEAIPGRSDQDLTTTLYSFKQSLGANQVFGRPVNRIATYLTIFEGAGSGKIHVIEIPDGDFSFADNIPHGDILSWARSSNGPKETVTLGNPYQGQCANSIFRSNPQPAPRATAPPPTPRPAVPRPAPRPATPPPQQQQKPNPVPVPKNNACAKRGMAYTFASAADMDTVKNGISWWYNWASQPVAAEQGHTRHGIEFVPMIWGERFLQNTVPAQSRFVLGFNEPNFFAQANIAAPRAASLWPRIEQTAQHRSTVSPAVNFCGGNPGCHDTDPFVYLDKFFSNCKNCKVDYIAVHWYACTGDALKWYLDRLRKYNKKVWVTEIACAPWDGNYKPGLDFQINYMREAIRILENDPMVVRYAWFSGRTTEIPDVNIFESQPGQLTRLGREYISQPCGRAQALQGSDESYTSQQTSPTKTGAGFALLGVLVSMLILLAVLLIMGLLYVFVRTRAKTEERV